MRLPRRFVALSWLLGVMRLCVSLRAITAPVGPFALGPGGSCCFWLVLASPFLWGIGIGVWSPAAGVTGEGATGRFSLRSCALGLSSSAPLDLEGGELPLTRPLLGSLALSWANRSSDGAKPNC